MPGMRIVARNLTGTPLTVDRKGHQLGAGEFGVVDPDDHVTKAALAAGNLGESERPPAGTDVDPGAAAAFAALDTDEADTGPEPTSEPAPAGDAAPAAEEPAKTTAARRR